MVHGDDRGLAFPPKVAPIQVVFIPVGPVKLREKVMARYDALAAQLRAAGIRIKEDTREEYSPGWKYNEYEMRGVPLRIELGPRDVDNNAVVAVRRDTGEKLVLSQDNLAEQVLKLLNDIQSAMFQKAAQFRAEHSHQAATLAELAEIISNKGGFVLAGWCGDAACEKQIKDETKATARNIPFDPPAQMPHCAACGAQAKHTVWYARAY
jgi:prolyl-tRNA synthetase